MLRCHTEPIMIVPFVALLSIVVTALLIVQLGSNALALTGLSQSTSRFQATSAFFGVGFTTSESELVVAHPLRRRIILHLIISGNIGLTSGLATIILTVVRSDPGNGVVQLLYLFLLLAAAVAVGLLFNVRWVKEPMDALMRRTLRRAGLMQVLDYEVLLRLKEGYSVCEVEIPAGHPFCDQPLSISRPSDRGLVVLGVHRPGGNFVGVPDGDTVLEAGDLLIVYGSESATEALRP